MIQPGDEEPAPTPTVSEGPNGTQIPPTPGDSVRPRALHAIRPMSILLAAAWTGIVTVLFVWLVVCATILRSGADRDRIVLFACQAVAYLSILLAVWQVHAGKHPIASFFGFRKTHWAFVPIAVGLGLALQAPVNELFRIIHGSLDTVSRGQTFELVSRASLARKIVILAITIGAGPLLEEMFFRGALYRPLLARMHPVLAVAMTGACFAAGHFQPELFLPVLEVGIATGWIRWQSGSLWPSIVLHSTFNAVPFWAKLQGDADAPVPVGAPILAASVGAVFVLLAIAMKLGSKSSLASDGRRADQELHPPRSSEGST